MNPSPSGSIAVVINKYSYIINKWVKQIRYWLKIAMPVYLCQQQQPV